MIAYIILLLIVVLDVFAIRDIYISQKESSLKFFYSCVVLLVPIFGFLIYYIIKSIKK